MNSGHIANAFTLGAITHNNFMTNNIDLFRQAFLGGNTWAERKDGIPLDLLDKLSEDELKIAENELIKSASLNDTWPILGLGHIKSTKSLPTLYNLLDKSNKGYKITIAKTIFEICQDQKMIDIVLEELPKTTNQYELINVLYMLTAFKDDKITEILNDYRNHKEYLIAYNATRALGLSTDDVVKNAQQKNEKKSFWKKLFG
jgi:hypothetical protein